MEIKVFRRKLYDKMLQWKSECGGKQCPIEFKSSGYKNHASLDAFLRKYPERVGQGYLLYTKDLRKDGSTTLLVTAFNRKILFCLSADLYDIVVVMKSMICDILMPNIW